MVDRVEQGDVPGSSRSNVAPVLPDQSSPFGHFSFPGPAPEAEDGGPLIVGLAPYNLQVRPPVGHIGRIASCREHARMSETTGVAEANPLRQGLPRTRVPDPCAIVLFGATGDLTHRKLVPALYHLDQGGHLPGECRHRRLRPPRLDRPAVPRRAEEVAGQSPRTAASRSPPGPSSPRGSPTTPATSTIPSRLQEAQGPASRRSTPRTRHPGQSALLPGRVARVFRRDRRPARPGRPDL